MGTASRPRLEFARAQSAHRVDDDVRGMIPDRARHRAQIDLHASGRLVVCQQNAGDLVFSVSAQPRSRPASKGCVLFLFWSFSVLLFATSGRTLRCWVEPVSCVQPPIRKRALAVAKV